MRWVDIAGGIRITLSNEENDLVEKTRKNKKVKKQDLDEREKEIARKLVSKGVLNRTTEKDKIFFVFNKLQENFWR